MPILRADDPLPHRPQRVAINGSAGSGKSTLARRLAATLDLPYTEMDSLFHGPGWTPLPDFVDVVGEVASQPRWVCEYQYDSVRPLLADRADLVVWLDLPRVLVRWRVVRRTVTRRLRREELWNGNREGPLRGVLTDPDHIVRYAWATHAGAGARTSSLLVSHPGLPIVQLRSKREIESWISGPLAVAT